MWAALRWVGASAVSPTAASAGAAPLCSTWPVTLQQAACLVARAAEKGSKQLSGNRKASCLPGLELRGNVHHLLPLRVCPKAGPAVTDGETGSVPDCRHGKVTLRTDGTQTAAWLCPLLCTTSVSSTFTSRSPKDFLWFGRLGSAPADTPFLPSRLDSLEMLTYRPTFQLILEVILS